MKFQFDIPLSSSSLDRCSQLRDDDKKIAYLLSNPKTKHFISWKSKLLFDFTTDVPDLVSFKSYEEVVSSFRKYIKYPPIFLGTLKNVPIFLHDISLWNAQSSIPELTNQFYDATRNYFPGLAETFLFCELRNIIETVSYDTGGLASTANGILAWHNSNTYCSYCGNLSEITLAGWQRVCPVCKNKQFPRTDPVVIMLITFGNNVLLGRSPAWPKYLYSCLAGFMEPGETIEQAVSRETFEESGIIVSDVKYLASQPWPFPSSLMIGCSASASTQDFTIDEKEIESVRWLSKDAVQNVLKGETSDWTPAPRGALARLMLENWAFG